MSQAGYTPISLYYSATGAAVPSAGNLVAGELALNTNDGKLYYKNSSGVVTLLAGATAGPAGGSTTQVQYNNAGVLAGITGATTNGTALTLVAPVLGTPASGIVTNLTGTASININGTVGATTTNTGAFTTLSASGTATMAAINASGTVAMAGAATVGTTLGVTGTSTMAAINASGSVTLSGTSFFRSPTTSNTPGTFNFYMAASGIREGTAGDVNIDTYNGGWGSRLAISQAGAVTIPGTLGVTGAATFGAGSATDVVITSLSSFATYNALSINGASSLVTMVGWYGGATGVTDLYANVPTGGSHYMGFAGSTGEFRLQSTGLTLGGTLGVGDITTNGNNKGLYFNGTRNGILGSNAADTVSIAAANANVAVFSAAATSLTGTLGLSGLLNITTNNIYMTQKDSGGTQRAIMGLGNDNNLYIGDLGTFGGGIKFGANGLYAMTLSSGGALSVTKTTAGDVLVLTNGGATPKPMYFYSDASTMSMGTSASQGGSLLAFVSTTSAQINISGGSVQSWTTAGTSVTGTLGVTGAATIGAASAGVGTLTINHATQPTIYLAKTNATATTWQIYNNGNLQFYDGTNTPLYFTGADSVFGGSIKANGTGTFISGIALGTSSVQGSVVYFGSSVVSAGAGTYPLKWNSSTGIVTYDTSSRLVKENIEDSPYGLAEVLQLKPRKYYRTDDQRNEIGLVADEVQVVLPEFVPLVPKSLFTKDEADIEMIAGGVYYDKLTSVLVKAIQELAAKFQDYKNSHP